MNVLMELYGIGDRKPQYRCKLKNRLQNTYNEKLTFLSLPDYHSSQIVISTTCFQNQNLSSLLQEVEPQTMMKKTAHELRSLVLEYNSKHEKLSWPPKIEELQDDKRQSPKPLIDFLQNLLVGDNSSIVHGKSLIIRSIADDVMYNISGGSFLTLKHCSLASGLHSMTRQKQPISFLERLGHCISYDHVAEIETAQAELASIIRNNSSILLLQQVQMTLR